ncbi:MAG: gliding motility-associated C-terminal domain-containing protein [Bacteroidetes bacterium]|nr:gliding motility-associated C-terminal domain-containing protein [Bacteroidota bacterium]
MKVCEKLNIFEELKKLFLLIFIFCIAQYYSHAQCPKCNKPGPNLISNPSFEEGNVGFNSSYKYGANGYGYYIIDKDASNFYSGFVGKDHTTGSGNFFIADGAGQANTVVWSEKIDSIIPNQDYYFSAWVSNLYNAPYSIFQFSINGNNISNTFSPTFAQGKWVQFYVVWNSGNDTTATISLINQNTTPNGNDFGLDDISFNTCIPNAVLSLNLGPDAPLCQGKDRILDAGSGFDSYLWNDGSIGQTLTASAPGKYWVAVTKTGCSSSDTVYINGTYPDPMINLGNDTFSCGDSIVLTANSNGWPVLWNTNDTGQILTVKTSGTYIASAGIPGCFDADTVNVFIYNLGNKELGNDTTLCEGDTLTISIIKRNSLIYQWSDGDSSRVKHITTQGLYILNISNSFCSFQDSLYVTFSKPPVVDLGIDSTLCFGSTYMLDATDSGSTYLWTTGDTTSTIVASESKKYIVTVYKYPCEAKDSVNIKIDKGVPILLKDTFELCQDKNDTIILYPGHATIYDWQPINVSDSILFITSGSQALELKLTNERGCITSKYIYIKEVCPPILFIPNAFSPNNNKINELFLVKGMYISNYRIRIYNRYGEKIYENTNLYEGWDGTYRDKPCATDLYVYIIEYSGSYKNDRFDEVETGKLILMR